MSDFRRLIGVGLGEGQLDAYRLLGLEPGEDDQEAIRRGIDRLRAILESLIGGPDTARSRKLLDAVAAAEVMLTDPARKRAFDEKLRGRLGSSGETAGGEAGGRMGLSGPGIVNEKSSVRLHSSVGTDDGWEPGEGLASSGETGDPADLEIFGPSPARGQVRRRLLVLGLAAVPILGFGLWWSSGSSRFPKHKGGMPPVAGTTFSAPRMPPAPAKASVPGLGFGVPRKVPGLEQVRDAADPALSADLKTIVLSGRRGGPDGNLDLFMAARDDVKRPFGTPLTMYGCDSDDSETCPSLTFDGLDLVFLRGGKPYFARRGTSKEPFAPPSPLDIPGVGLPLTGPIDTLQLSADGLSLAIKTDGPPLLHLATRPSRDAPFEKATPLPVWYPWAINAFSADLLRDYASNDDGLAIGSRRGLKDRFGMPGLIQLLMPRRVGPIIGRFWIAPAEDVLIYSSTGPPPPRSPQSKQITIPAKAADDAYRSLWMVRFR